MSTNSRFVYYSYMKKLYRSLDERTVSGLLGGIADYFNVDPTLVRVVFIFLLLVTGIIPGIIAYIIAVLITPNAPHAHVHEA